MLLSDPEVTRSLLARQRQNTNGPTNMRTPSVSDRRTLTLKLIGASASTVQQGAGQVSTAVSTMGEIERAVRQVNDILREISHASQEQSGGIQQVNVAVSQIDKVTQQNAALVEQAAAAAQSLKDQATSLWEVIGRFSLPETIG